MTEKFDKTGELKSPSDDRAYYVSQMRHFEGQGTVVPTRAGLGPMLMAEDFDKTGDFKSPSDDRDGRPYQRGVTSLAYGRRVRYALLRQGYEGFLA